MDIKRKQPENGGGRSIGIRVLSVIRMLEQIRKIQREIGRVNNKIQIDHLMRTRSELLARVSDVKSQLARSISPVDSFDLEMFQNICETLETLGRGVSESIVLSLEYESNHDPLRIISQPEIFNSCVQKILGKKPANKIEAAVTYQLGERFGLQLSKRSTLKDAIRIAKEMEKEKSIATIWRSAAVDRNSQDEVTGKKSSGLAEKA